MEVVKETDVLNEVRYFDHRFTRWAQRSGIGVIVGVCWRCDFCHQGTVNLDQFISVMLS
jgi:hypothetical protein